MSEITLFRVTALTLIKQNPSTIQITKKVYADNGTGGQTETITSSKSFVGRIYRRGASSPLEIIQQAGAQEREEYSLLAPYNAEIDEPSENVKQTFTVNEETYLITTLFITRREDAIISKRALLTKVD